MVVANARTEYRVLAYSRTSLRALKYPALGTLTNPAP